MNDAAELALPGRKRPGQLTAPKPAASGAERDVDSAVHLLLRLRLNVLCLPSRSGGRARLRWRLLPLFTVLAVLLSGCAGGSGGSRGDRLPGRANGAAEGGAGAAASWEVPRGVKARAWRHIVLHHSGTSEGSAAAFDRYHRSVKGWRDLGYHFVIGNGRGTPDGSVEVSRRWKEQRAGAHAGVRYYNERGVGVCLVGNFERSVPTERQMASLSRLLAFLMKRFDIPSPNVFRHSDLVSTKCPGKRFPWPVVGR